MTYRLEGVRLEMLKTRNGLSPLNFGFVVSVVRAKFCKNNSIRSNFQRGHVHRRIEAYTKDNKTIKINFLF